MKGSESLLRRLIILRDKIVGSDKRNLGTVDYIYVDDIYNRVVFGGSLTASEVVKLNDLNKHYANIIIPKKAWAGKRVCFSGFRNTAMEKEIINNGGYIDTTVTRNTNYLIIKSQLKTKTSKILKAEQFGVKVVHKEDFHKIK